MSFFIGLTPGIAPMFVKEKGTYKEDITLIPEETSGLKNDISGYAKGALFTCPLIVGYKSSKGKTQVKLGISANLWWMSQTLGCLRMRDLGTAKFSIGYVFNDRWTISASVGVNATQISKSTAFVKKIDIEDRTKEEPALSNTMWTPIGGVELQYKVTQKWHVLLGFQIGGSISQSGKSVFLIQESSKIERKRFPIGMPFPVIEKKTLKEAGETLADVKRSGFIGRVVIGALYEMGGSR